MTFYRIRYEGYEGACYEWFKTKRGASARHRELKREQDQEGHVCDAQVWQLTRPERVEFGRNKTEVLHTLNLFCCEGHA